MAIKAEFLNLDINKVKPSKHNVKTHPEKQIDQLAAMMSVAAFIQPIAVDENNVILAGHARLLAGKKLGYKTIPVYRVSGLSTAKKRAVRLADNRLAQNSGWDRKGLFEEHQNVAKLLSLEGIDPDIIGFEPPEIDALHIDFGAEAAEADDKVDVTGPAVSQPGDLWVLGDHRLLCGDSLRKDSYQELLGSRQAAAVVTDPPFNLAAKAIGGRGATKHDDFAMAAGEMTQAQFRTFLKQALGLAAKASCDGAVHYVAMDWRHLSDLSAAAAAVYAAQLNLVVWVKTNAGQGSFYRSQHELIGVYRVGRKAHLNTVQLGKHGRNRSNVWTYAGANSFRAGRMDDLKAHPTVKPTAMVADALKDCTRRGDIVLDPFCGSGATLLAAEKVGRCGYGIEISPDYVDVAIRRWEKATGRDAVHMATGLTFARLAQKRSSPARKRNGRGR